MSIRSEPPVTDELRSLVHRSITEHVRLGEQAIALADEIGDQAWRINRQGLGKLFRLLQVMLANELTLAITKLFESPDKRYPERRSIPVVLRFLEERADELPVRDRSRLEGVLTAGPTLVQDIDKMSDADLTRAASRQLRLDLPKPKAFWFRRDKRIAHTDDAAVPEGFEPSWAEGRRLIQHAQRVAGILGDAYGIYHFEANDGSYMLSSIAKEAARDLNKVLAKADLIDKNRGKRPRHEHRGLIAEAEEENGIWLARVTDSEENITAVESSLEEAFQEITVK